MLSRIANNIFWMGRYIERGEHLARYSREQYFSTLDAPIAINKKMALSSILRMSGAYDDYLEKYKTVTSENVFDFSAKDPGNLASIHSCIKIARENARSARYKLSAEAYEALNKLYHFSNKFIQQKVPEEQWYEYYQSIINDTYITKGFITNTLMRDEVWLIINTGVHLEKAIQVNRMILTKYQDINHLDKEKLITPVENYFWGNLLKSTDCLDIVRRVYKCDVSKDVVMDFLVLNKNFPKSILHNLQSVNRSINRLNPSKRTNIHSVEFFGGKLEAQLKYMTFDDIKENGNPKKNIELLKTLLDKLYKIADLFEKQYLT
ncbi:alpha-E domain-containing protein [Flexithrix dorotheae]|uniref:alpha-E domain-containing protein n=1 Tax=Flexithrix dorotheae TaxID=70993 RepID=UPI0003A363D2|nr:alpha-E domain-containing protein [Flexithrix dorotheae]